MPPVAPNVWYQGGELTIQAQNSTLAQVLHAVQSKTGASVDVPASASNDRVVAQIGPGRPQEVLATLLNGSKFNYIIMGSPNEPGVLRELILTPKTNAPITNTAQNRPVQPPPEPQEEEYTPPEPIQENSAENQESPKARYHGFVPNPGQFPGQEPATGTTQPQQQQKSPEQLLQELQRFQQQQEQYQQQLNPANRTGPEAQQPEPQ